MACRKESYFLEFMYVDVALDFVGVVFHVLLDCAKGSYNHRDCCCFEPHIRLLLLLIIIIIIITKVPLDIFFKNSARHSPFS